MPRKFEKGQSVRYVGSKFEFGCSGIVDRYTSPTRYRVVLTDSEGCVIGITCREEEIEPNLG